MLLRHYIKKKKLIDIGFAIGLSKDHWNQVMDGFWTLDR
jgi:hypothetical protein